MGDILRRNKLYRNVHSGGISAIRCVQVNQRNAAGVQNRLQRDKVELGIHAIECSVNLGTLGPIGQLLRSFNDFDVRKDKGRYRNLDLGNGILVEVHIKRKSILEERAIGNRERRRVVDRFHVNNDGPYFAHDRMICSFDKNIRERVVTMEIQFRTIDKRTQLGELGQLAMLGRIDRNNDEIVAIQVGAIRRNATGYRNGKVRVLIRFIFNLRSNRSRTLVLDCHDKRSLY